ncbi:MAG: AAA family ATPase [bacterium]|nr:AAA family ATPase [bacterium]
MFERVYIENYKCLANFDLYLQDITLLLGANGTGKTAVLDVVYGLRELLAGDAKIADSVAFPPSTLTRWQTHRHQQFVLQVRAGGEVFSYWLRVEHHADSGVSWVTHEKLAGEDETVLFNCEGGTVQLYQDDGTEGPTYGADWSESALARVVPHPANTRITSFLKAVRNTVVCTVRPYGLRTESNREDRLLNRHASNFVDWYRHAVQETPRLALAHVEALRSVIPGFDDLRLTQAGLDTRALMFSFDASDGSTEQGGGRYWLRFSELSDGQRALAVLYGLLHLSYDDEGICVFLDEPENYVALPEIQPWLMALVKLCQETPSQAVICSHHPELIDYLGPEHGQILQRNESGATTPQRLSPGSSGHTHRLSELVARGWEG